MNSVMTKTRHRQTNAAFTVSREYDALDRVTSSYVYDLCGNRLSVTAPSGTASATYTHNRRDADTYDAGGRVTRTVNGRGQVLDLAWNLLGGLVSVSTNGVFAEGYAYDPMGRRISTTDANGTVYHAYDGIHCVADLAPDGTLLRSYTWGSGVDNLLAVTLYSATETNTLYAVTDPLGTVHALVGTNGVPAVTYAYDSWGNPLSVSGDETLASSLRFAWQGREYSRATALYSFRARWYDPASGRWLSKDPIGLEGGLNLYEAFGSNPVCFRDPEGNIIKVKIVSKTGTIETARNQIDFFQLLFLAAKNAKDSKNTRKISIFASYAFFAAKINPFSCRNNSTLNDPTMSEFRNAIRNEQNNSIQKLEISGHGNYNYMCIAPGEYGGDGIVWQKDENKKVQMTDNLEYFSDLIRFKLTKDSEIILNGCNTAREFFLFDYENIAKQLSRELPGVVVTGNRGFGIGNKIYSLQIGKETYVYGVKRHYRDGEKK